MRGVTFHYIVYGSFKKRWRTLPIVNNCPNTRLKKYLTDCYPIFQVQIENRTRSAKPSNKNGYPHHRLPSAKQTPQPPEQPSSPYATYQPQHMTCKLTCTARLPRQAFSKSDTAPNMWKGILAAKFFNCAKVKTKRRDGLSCFEEKLLCLF